MMTMIPGMWLMLQQDKPDDFVLATGHMHSVREFVEVNIVTDVIIVNVLVIIIIMLIMMTRLPVSTLEWSLSGKGAATAKWLRRRKLEL